MAICQTPNTVFYLDRLETLNLYRVLDEICFLGGMFNTDNKFVHHDTQQHVVTLIVISSTTASSFQTNVFRQTFLQRCSAICLELSANICSEL